VPRVGHTAQLEIGVLLVADGNTSSADRRYNGTASGRGVAFVPDNYLGGVTTALECNAVGHHCFT
jgi:hypothetical protein